MKLLKVLRSGAAVAGLAFASAVVVSSPAAAAAPVLTELTSAIDVSTVITAMLGAAALMIGIMLAWLGIKYVLRAIR